MDLSVARDGALRRMMKKQINRKPFETIIYSATIATAVGRNEIRNTLDTSKLWARPLIKGEYCVR